MAKYLVDTCVWRDFFQNRVGRRGNPLGKYASNFFIMVFKNKDEIVFPREVYFELRREYSAEEINERLKIIFFNNILINTVTTKTEIVEARMLSKTREVPFVDCLIAVHAKNCGAVVVTQDKHFFKSLRDIVKSIRPNEVS